MICDSLSTIFFFFAANLAKLITNSEEIMRHIILGYDFKATNILAISVLKFESKEIEYFFLIVILSF